MIKKDTYSVSDFLGADFDCECGHHHSTRFKNYIIGEGVINELPGLLRKLGYSHPFILCDTHTNEVAGNLVEALLKENGFEYGKLILKSPEVGDIPADEKAMGTIVMGYDKKSDITLSVGSGTINDLGRYFSDVAGRPFMLVATAPSMDGLVSNNAPLIYNRMKITFKSQAPVALICDMSIMKEAPMKMLSAGVGDILGKYNCLIDWKLANIVTGEYYCDFLASIVKDSVEKTVKSTETLLERRSGDVALLTEALCLSGVAMDFATCSRPASGAEHHMSHFLEMQFLFDGIPAILHGTKVGINTIVALRLYNELAKMPKPDFEKIRKNIPNRQTKEEWTKEIRRAYREGAEGVLLLEETAKKNDPELLEKRLSVLQEKWDEIIALAKTAPKAEMIEKILLHLGAPVRAGEVGVSNAYIRDGVRYAKELRNLYSILQLYWDLDMLDDAADFIVKEYGSKE